MIRTKLTTIDNPYDPFTQFDDWYAYDVNNGYNTCAYLARCVVSSDELSDELQEDDVVDAIESICRTNVLGIYKKVQKDVDES